MTNNCAFSSFSTIPKIRDITDNFTVQYPENSDNPKTIELKNVNFRQATFDDEYSWYSLYDAERMITTRQSYHVPILGYTYGLFGSIVTATDSAEFPVKALLAHYHLEKVYEFYKDIGWNSYDGHGAEINAVVGYESMGDQAAWSYNLKRILFGTGGHEAALDVVGHEFTHGVFNSRVKDIGKSKNVETRALDEAYADIMGCLIEGNTSFQDLGRLEESESQRLQAVE